MRRLNFRDLLDVPMEILEGQWIRNDVLGCILDAQIWPRCLGEIERYRQFKPWERVRPSSEGGEGGAARIPESGRTERHKVNRQMGSHSGLFTK